MRFEWQEVSCKHLGTGPRTSEEARMVLGLARHARHLAAALGRPGVAAAQQVRDLSRRVRTSQWAAEHAEALAAPAALGSERLLEVAASLEARAAALEGRFQAQRTRSWRSWCMEAAAGGGRAAHAWSRGPAGWAPDVWTPGGPAGAQRRVEATLRAWADGPWQCSDPPFDSHEAGHGDAMPPISGTQVAWACKRFAARTATPADGWHPRHWALMGPGAAAPWRPH